MTSPQLQPRRAGAGRGTALVTGATAGIGLELARLLAADGFDLILVARSDADLRRVADALMHTHGVAATPLVADLADPAAPRHIFDTLAARNVAVEILVNNAGFGLSGPLIDLDGQHLLEMIQVNVAALTALTRLFLPAMLERRRGRVMNVASTAAFQPGPLMAVYYATKAYVLSFSEAVAEETRHTGVTITALCPGPTATRFAERANMRSARLFSSVFVMSAGDVARFGYRAMMRGKRVAIPGVLNRLVVFSTRLAPRRFVTRVSRGLQETR